jgi:uncharacterized MAPEG superfamily protein
MTPLLEITLYFAIWTFLSVLAGAAIRNQEWTREGREIGLGNRDNLKEATPMGGRAERAANNSIEAMAFFLPLAFVAHAAGMDAEALLGAQIAFWARVAYVPIYIAGIKYLRSLVWIVGAVGYCMMAATLL